MEFELGKVSPCETLDNYKSWFEQWEKFSPWSAKKQSVVRMLNYKWAGYASDFSAQKIDIDREEKTTRRMTYCWIMHWKDFLSKNPAVEEADERTIEALENGQGFKSKGRLGSNPLRDLALTEAMTTEWNSAVKEDDRTKAKRYFEKQFGKALRGWAYRNSNVELDPKIDWRESEWYSTFYYHLIGIGRSVPILEKYTGGSGLGAWLQMVFRSFFRPRKVTGKDGEKRPLVNVLDVPDDPNGGISPFDIIEVKNEIAPEMLAELNDYLENVRKRMKDELAKLVESDSKLLIGIVYLLNRYLKACDLPTKYDGELTKLWGNDVKTGSRFASKAKERLPKILGDLDIAKFSDSEKQYVAAGIACVLNEFVRSHPLPEGKLALDTRVRVD